MPATINNNGLFSSAWKSNGRDRSVFKIPFRVLFSHKSTTFNDCNASAICNIARIRSECSESLPLLKLKPIIVSLLRIFVCFKLELVSLNYTNFRRNSKYVLNWILMRLEDAKRKLDEKLYVTFAEFNWFEIE